MAKSKAAPVCVIPACDRSTTRPAACAMESEGALSSRVTCSEKTTPSRRNPVEDRLAMLFATTCISRIRPDWRVSVTYPEASMDQPPCDQRYQPVLEEADQSGGHEAHRDPEHGEHGAHLGNECQRHFLHRGERLKQADHHPGHQRHKQQRRRYLHRDPQTLAQGIVNLRLGHHTGIRRISW
jgi:hypothetical protein